MKTPTSAAAAARKVSRAKPVINKKKPSDDELLSQQAASSRSAINAKKSNSMLVLISSERKPLQMRDAEGCLIFADFPEFRPNLTPLEVLEMGSFGGTYFRKITSRVTGLTYGQEVIDEVQQWASEKPFSQADIRLKVASPTYNWQVNTYKTGASVKCAQASLDEWETKCWIRDSDPYGWFQWYCRFFYGRRCDDDGRQVVRALAFMGPRGRFRMKLMNSLVRTSGEGKALGDCLSDVSILPNVRQILQHWSYRCSLADVQAHAKT